ncbi:MAG: hypothetical protein WCT37_03725 [Patescibacteria group bacterium]|jgi:hypothetical protein
MSPRLKIIILAVVGLIVAGILIWAVIKWQSGAAPTNTNANLEPLVTANHLIINDNVKVADTAVTKDNASTLDAAAQTEISLERQAASFAERFGSYSNQNNFENFRDLLPLMTDSMKAWTEKQMSQPRATGAYWGVTTRAFTVKIAETGKDSVSFLITTQRRESGADTNQTKSYNQDLKLTYVKTGDQWLVDGAFWQ